VSKKLPWRNREFNKKRQEDKLRRNSELKPNSLKPNRKLREKPRKKH
jgi:hypothetical protein